MIDTEEKADLSPVDMTEEDPEAARETTIAGDVILDPTLVTDLNITRAVDIIEKILLMACCVENVSDRIRKVMATECDQQLTCHPLKYFYIP